MNLNDYFGSLLFQIESFVIGFRQSLQIINKDNMEDFGKLVIFTIYDFFAKRMYFNFLTIACVEFIPHLIHYHLEALGHSKGHH